MPTKSKLHKRTKIGNLNFRALKCTLQTKWVSGISISISIGNFSWFISYDLKVTLLFIFSSNSRITTILTSLFYQFLKRLSMLFGQPLFVNVIFILRFRFNFICNFFRSFFCFSFSFCCFLSSFFSFFLCSLFSKCFL